MYSNNFAAALLVNGKVLREFDDVVYLPFGSEYTIRLKNLNTHRAKVHIEIDGEDVTDGGLVVGAFQTTDLERFIRNGNLKQGNRFKFIERSQKIEEHRGIKTEDGVISIRYEFERTVPTWPSYEYRSMPKALFSSNSLTVTTGFPPGIGTNACSEVMLNSPLCGSICSLPTSDALSTNEIGITVEGSVSRQSFSTTTWGGSKGATHVLNIRLLGESADNREVRQPVTVKTKIECKTCGTINPATAKFCSECGTSLSIV